MVTVSSAQAESSSNDRGTPRLIQFSDGIFTVALTLLVIDITMPTLPNGFSQATLVAQLTSFGAG